jgi:hypothetical protein
MSNTYWKRSFNNFQNQYAIGVATTGYDAQEYETEGYQRISRDYALRLMSDRGDNSTPMFVYVTINGDRAWDRFTVARAIRKGEDLHTCP